MKQAEDKRDGVINTQNPQNYNLKHEPSGTIWSTSSDTGQVVEIRKKTSTKMYTHFKSDLFNNIDHMRISGTEPSSVILSNAK